MSLTRNSHTLFSAVLYRRVRGKEAQCQKTSEHEIPYCICDIQIGDCVLWVGWSGVLAILGLDPKCERFL